MVPSEPRQPPRPTDPTSAPWIRRVVAGSGESADWQALFDRYRVALAVYAARQLGPQLARLHSPEDLVQSAWADVLARIDDFEYRGRGSLRAWLRIKIRREATNLARRADKDGDAMPAEEAVASDRVPEEVAGRELHARLLASLDSLPATYRRVVEARYVEGHKVVAIARAHELKPDTVSQQLRRGLSLWRQAFGDDPSRHLGTEHLDTRSSDDG